MWNNHIYILIFSMAFSLQSWINHTKGKDKLWRKSTGIWARWPWCRADVEFSHGPGFHKRLVKVRCYKWWYFSESLDCQICAWIFTYKHLYLRVKVILSYRIVSKIKYIDHIHYICTCSVLLTYCRCFREIHLAEHLVNTHLHKINVTIWRAGSWWAYEPHTGYRWEMSLPSPRHQ